MAVQILREALQREVTGLSKSEEKKVMEAMKKDETTIQRETAALFAAAKALVPIVIHTRNPANPTVEIQSRILKRGELAVYTHRIGQIHPGILDPTCPGCQGICFILVNGEATDKKCPQCNGMGVIPIVLTPKQNEALTRLYDELIQDATGISKETMQAIDVDAIRLALVRGIITVASISQQELEALNKFRRA